MDNRPIGVFDSGLGGLSAVKELKRILPNESILYFGDTGRVPYGTKSRETLLKFSAQDMNFLIKNNVKVVVAACGTVSSTALQLGKSLPVPYFDVIAPTAAAAAKATENGKVGVIGTAATIRSRAYQDLFDAVPGVDVSATDCPRFVDFVERGITSGRQILGLAEGYLAPLQADGVDTLVLGCTHYPLLSGVVQLAMGDDVTLVSSAEETAKDVLRTLTKLDLLADPETDPPSTRIFESTGDPEMFQRLAARFLGPAITDVSPHAGH